jgi:MFS transporter, FHS family, Na+ dependent glucose transporter 1
LTTISDPRSQVPRLHPRIMTSAYYLAFIIMGLFVGLVGLALPYLAANTHSQINQISFIFMASSFGYLIGSLFSGGLYDRLPGNRILGAVLAAIACGGILTPVIHRLWILVPLCFVMGMSNNGMDVGCNSMLVWVHGRRVGPFLNGLHFFFGVGAFVSPLVAAQVVRSTGGVTGAYWLFAGLALVCAVLIWNLPSPKAHAVPRGKNGSVRIPIILLALFASCYLLHAGSQVSFGNWLYTYAVRMGLANPATAAGMTSAFWGLFAVGRLLAIGISTRVRPQTILFTDLFGALASLAVVVVFPGSSAALWIGVIGVGLFMASIYPTTLAFAERRMPLTGTITSRMFMGGGVGGMIVPWLIGQFFDPVGPRVTMVIIAAVVAAHLGVMVWLTLLKSQSPEGVSRS